MTTTMYITFCYDEFGLTDAEVTTVNECGLFSTEETYKHLFGEVAYDLHHRVLSENWTEESRTTWTWTVSHTYTLG